MPDRKREGQNFKARTLLKRIQKELKTTKGYNGKSVFQADFTDKGEKTISMRKVSSAIVAGFDVAKRKVTGKESRKSLLLKEKKIKHMIGDLKAIDSKVYVTDKGEKDSKGKPVEGRSFDTRTNASPQTIKKSRRSERERMK